MLYRALRPCRFDKSYSVGDIIPGNVIDPGKVNTLVKEHGIIVPIEGVEEISHETPNKQEEISHETTETWTTAKLLELKKANLLEIASALGLPVDDEMTKSMIADAIMLAQGE